ncbi:MAG: hypothetical protein M1837_000154 [Sclerophora amabilis]|nr:MAG: hypothetical protein M1837_000154 [Sclerophora amabilis]
MQQNSVGEKAVKEQVVDHVPKRIREIEFGILSNQDIVKQGVIEISDRQLYDLNQNRAPVTNGLLDPRLVRIEILLPDHTDRSSKLTYLASQGTCDKASLCETCSETLQLCNGHFGHVKLALPAFHVGYFKMIMMILQDICKGCSRMLLPESDRRSFLRDLRRPNIDNLRRTQICKKISDQCKKAKTCPKCGEINGTVKKAGPLKIVHDRFQAFNASNALKKKPPETKIVFDLSFSEAKKGNAELERHVKKAMDDLNPIKVLKLFRQITATDCELLGLNPAEGRPEMFIWQYVPAPPICIRPSVAQDSASTEDDITAKLADIIHISSLIRGGLERGQPVQTIMEQWEFLQLQIAMYINSDVPGLQQAGFGKTIRGFCQRLKGKQGRFRGNLSGKRVDFSGRTVISPDPNLGIDEVAIPVHVAKNLTYPEKVTSYNIRKLQGRVRNGANKWPGANYILKKNSDFKMFLKYGKMGLMADQLQIGDVVERHLEDRDIVLFNRQPSLHKLSILSHYAKIRPSKTFRLNECVCNPYNADFDGDEMNLHVPQTEEARTEAIQLMGVKNNLVTPKNGEPIIAAIQDFITAAYLLSRKDVFYDRKTFTHICMSMVDGNMLIDLPSPAIVKPQRLWTGKQVFNVLMRPNKHSPVLVNLDAACREYKVVHGQPRDLDQNDGWLVVRNSEIMCGVLDKSTIGSGKKDSIFYVILRDFGPDAAVQAMNRLAKLAARWLTNEGFSIGISDVYPGQQLRDLKEELIQRAYAECDEVIAKFQANKLERSSGCNEEQTMENKISGILNKVRQQAGDYCIKELSKWNSPLIMATSGSKGSNINVSQMVAVVGQQIIGKSRVPDGFQDRSLPHFPKNARQPPSKGFVENSFFSGLNPTEFLFHAISGREGLVDTAVKTAETGYMSRRLMKSLEDLSTRYDDTVQNSSSGVVQFQYGDDKLDPVDMEGKAKPVHFDRTYNHCEAITWSDNDPALSPADIQFLCDRALAPEEAKLERKALDGSPLAYDDQTDAGTDHLESMREFLQSIKEYLNIKAGQVAEARRKRLLPVSDTDHTASRNDAILSVSQVAKVSARTLQTFIGQCLSKYKRAQVEPGHAVGAVGAQSIGEPGTQMTLKTFHFAGVAGMSITQGVPRIKEIINASKLISTPVITCELIDKENIRSARIVKSRIEKTYLEDIIYYIADTWSHNANYLHLKVDRGTIEKLHLDITTEDVMRAIVAQKKLKIKAEHIRIHGRCIRIDVHPVEPSAAESRKTAASRNAKDITASAETSLFYRVAHLKRVIPTIVVSGYPDASRAVIKTDSGSGKNTLLVEGYGLKACMSTLGVVGTATTTNSVMETREVLGVEAARSTIIAEIGAVMGDMEIDPRHMQLLADVMTYKGEILGITRFGLAKMRDSVLQLASFEKTPDHLFEAAARMKRDRVEGVSECIIMGQAMSVGTGAFRVVRSLGMMGRDGDKSVESSSKDGNVAVDADADADGGGLGRKPTIFEDCWRQSLRQRRGRSRNG